jgi:hypothetical protein
MTNTQAYLTTGVLVAGTWAASELGGAGGFMLFAMAACMGFMLVAWRKGELKVRKLGQGDGGDERDSDPSATAAGGLIHRPHEQFQPIVPAPDFRLSDDATASNERYDPLYSQRLDNVFHDSLSG